MSLSGFDACVPPHVRDGSRGAARPARQALSPGRSVRDACILWNRERQCASRRPGRWRPAEPGPMDEPKHYSVATNGITMQVTERGEGPLVVLCHGWPESAFSWRHQIPALAAAGYRVVAPDMRGYGGTSAPQEVLAYTLFHLVGDVVGLEQALGEEQAVIVGHDWGAAV